MFYEIIWKNMVEPDRPQMTIWSRRIACWIPKATNEHSEYVILIVFPLQQWLHERPSMVGYSAFSVLFPDRSTLFATGYVLNLCINLQYCKCIAWRSSRVLTRHFLYFLNITSFTVRVNIVEIYEHPSYTDFHTTHRRSSVLCSDLVYRISPKTDSTSVKYGYKLIYTLCEICFLLFRYSENSYITDNLLWTSPVPNFIQTERKT
jgi:hypothetical protein